MKINHLPDYEGHRLLVSELERLIGWVNYIRSLPSDNHRYTMLMNLAKDRLSDLVRRMNLHLQIREEEETRVCKILSLELLDGCYLLDNTPDYSRVFVNRTVIRCR